MQEMQAGDMGSILWDDPLEEEDPLEGRSLGGGNGNPLQYSCLENQWTRGAWWATVHGVTKNQT